MPDRDYYVSDSPDNKEKREKYVAHVARMLQFIGDDAAKAKSNAEKILVFETSLAKPTLDRVERRDRRKTYNPMSVSDLQKMFPTNNWDAYFEKMGLPKLDSYV